MIQTKFESFCKTQDSMASLCNPKLIRQRFGDFQTKLKVWKQRDRFRARMKKQFKRHVSNLNEVFENAIQMFTNDQDVVHDCSQIYSDFQDHLRKCYKNEKTLNSFLCGLPEMAQQFEPDDL